MPLAATRAFLVSRQTINENDRLVTLLTENNGLQKAVAPGAARGKNRFGSALELFTHLNIFYYWHQERELWTISRAEILESFYEEISRPESIFEFFTIAEIISRATAENICATKTYRLTSALLNTLKQGVPARFLLIYFLIWFLKIEGLFFDIQKCSSCLQKLQEFAALKTDYSGLLCAKCYSTEKWILSPADLNFFSRILKSSPLQSFYELSSPPARLTELLFEKLEFQLELKLQSRYCLSSS